jgi:ankyrin repeat protein
VSRTRGVSKTSLTGQVKAFAWEGVAAALDAKPELLDVRDSRGRTWLHLCCSVDVRARPRAAPDSVRTADVLLTRGLDIDDEAFTEGAWKATPLWYAIGRGRNLTLAQHLLEQGCNPDYALWAAAFNDDIPAIELLARYGATIDDPAVPDETPFLAAVKVSRFGPAEALLDLGADVDVRDPSGMTALHYMLKKQSDIAHLRTVIAHGARGDIPDAAGNTAVDILRRKRDPELRALAEVLAGR